MIISRQSVEVFVKYGGDPDAFDRVATPQEQALLTGDVVRRIEEIILRLSLIQSGAASASYTTEGAELVGSRSIEPSALQLLASFVASGHAHRGAQA